MGLKTPDFILKIDDNEITEAQKTSIISITIDDKVGFASDTLVINIFRNGRDELEIEHKIEVFIGYEKQQLVKYGTYVISDLELSENTQTINLISFPSESLKEVTHLLIKESKSLEEIMKEICKKTKLQVKVCKELQTIKIKDYKISNETRLHALVKLANNYGAFLKINDDTIIMTKRSLGKSVSGGELQKLTLKKEDVEKNWKFKLNKPLIYNSVKAKYGNTESIDDLFGTKQNVVIVGKGEPEFELKKTFTNKRSAEESAKAKLQELKRSKQELSFSIEGDAEFRAERSVNVAGFSDKIDKIEWLIESAKHELSSKGYKTSVTCVTMLSQNELNAELETIEEQK